ncbi:sulfite exporter TauE/SafE family protein [Mitsuokella sp. AF21-1AC]|uniref:sulfite exporter TauE/SafE family protein n=1 Tax=Mitsuokella sp. AF21-1AC TaxID=2292235 RepID=UPI000E4E5BD9|nr:sulfite exporter TauE/SafE family protein [Mitsuokella sp. AF21-1AC]RGS73536.1 sulfite exporter TauE/SafE family protein [Mitsuokella sp. AF21-1AC]
MDITAWQAHLWPALAIGVAAFMQGITGFGLVIIAAPLLMLFYDPRETVLMMFVVGLITSIVQTFLVWKDARYKLIGAILVGYIVAQPFGFWIFAHFSANQLKLLVSTVILVSLLLMQFTHHEFSLCRRNSILMGILAGLCGVTTGMAGPPLILYFAYTKMTPAELRGTSVVFFLISGIISIGFFLFQGVSMYSAAVESIYLIPALVIGLLLGHAVIRFVSVKLFRFLIFFMLYFICAYMFYELAVQ